MVELRRVQPDVPNIIAGIPRDPAPPGKVRFSFRVDALTAERLDELEQRIEKYKARKAKYSNERVVRTLSLDPAVHAWMKAEAERCGMTLGRFTGRLLSDPDLDEPKTAEQARDFVNLDGTWHRVWTEPDPSRTARWAPPASI